MKKTAIEYGDYGWNFFPGCLHKQQGICPPTFTCWAEAMTKRQRGDFHEPHLIAERLLDPLKKHKPGRVLVNFMGDLFGDWVDPNQRIGDWWEDKHYDFYYPPGWSLKDCVFDVLNLCPDDRFLFLTKRPDRLQLWSPFPENCYVGVSVTGAEQTGYLVPFCKVEAPIKFLSIEPLLAPLYEGEPDILEKVLVIAGIKWVIIGQVTPIKQARMPKIEWISEIIEACDKAGIPVWLKNNLNPLFAETTTIADKWVFSKTNFMRGELYRQEVPDD